MAGAGGAEAGAGARCAGAPEGRGELLRPDERGMGRQAPEAFEVRFRTSRGDFGVAVTRAWAPRGADRFYNLVLHGFFDGTRFYRVLKNWVCQFGVSQDPAVSAVYNHLNDAPGAILPDEPARPDLGASNLRGAVAYSAAYDDAGARATNRTTEIYINYQNNSRLDVKGFAPFGIVTYGMDSVVEALYDGYGEMEGVCELHPELEHTCNGVNEDKLYARGGAYLEEAFPNLDYIIEARLEPPCPFGVEGAGARYYTGEGRLLATALLATIAVSAIASGMMYFRNRTRREIARKSKIQQYMQIKDDGL